MEDLIKRAQEEDLPGILAVQKKAFKVLADQWNRHDIEPMLETLAHLTEEFNEGIILKYVFDGKIAGSVRGRINGNGNCFIGKLSVDPDVQNKGVGRRLMQAIEECFPECPGFELFTSAATPNTRRLYESMGYKLTEKPSSDRYVVFYEKTNKTNR